MNDDAKILIARGCLAVFSTERPLIVGPAIAADMIHSGAFDDMLDRVLVVGDLGEPGIRGDEWIASLQGDG